MEWITSEEKINRVLNTAYTCVAIDSGRMDTSLTRMVFDELGLDSSNFARLVLLLTGLSGEAEADFVVLRPDPIRYYKSVIGRYPAFSLRVGDTPDAYLEALSERLNPNEIDNVGTFWSECVVASPEGMWFAHVVRTSGETGGHLWIPEKWTQQASSCYRWLVPQTHMAER